MSAIRTKSFDRRGREVTMTVPANEKRAAAQPSADEAYKAEQARTVALLKRLAERLDGHAAKQAGDTKNWGYLGDLQYINQQLARACGDEV